MESFNPFADSLDISFTCPHCHEKTSYRVNDVPSPDWSGDTAASSENYDDDDFCCEHCNHPYSIDVFVNIYDGEIVIRDSETNEEVKDLKVEEYFLYEDEDDVERTQSRTILK